MLKNNKILAILLWFTLILTQIYFPISWEHLSASVQGLTNITANVKVAPPKNFNPHWTYHPDCRIETVWDVSDHCNPATSGPNCYVEGYELTWQTSSGGSLQSLNITPGNSSGHTILSLPCNDQNYDLTLTAYYGNRYSTTVNAKTNTPPNNATNLSCSDLFTDNITLSWNKSTSSWELATQNLYQDGVLIHTFNNSISTTLVTGLLSGTEYTFRITSLNADWDESLGNGGATVTCVTDNGIPPDTTPPSGTVEINGGTTHTNLNIVNLSLTTDDATDMEFSNSIWGPWSGYEPFSTSKNDWDLNESSYGGNSDQGTKTVYVKLRDDKGNETTVEISDSIEFDSLRPVTTASPLGGRYATNQTITLSTDADSTIQYAVGVEDNCSGGTAVYNTYTNPFEITDDTNEGKVCFFATDTAGNVESIINEETYVIDTQAPESHALTLEEYSTSRTFEVPYTTSNNTDLDYVELYYSVDGWPYQQYSDTLHTDWHFFLSPIDFEATTDGHYRFFTRATDDLGNTEEIPSILPDEGAEITVDTVAPVDPFADLDASTNFTCKNTHTPRCHTDIYDVPVTFTDNADFAEIYISGDVTGDSGSTYYGNINQWIPFTPEITIPLDPNVSNPDVSKNKTITYKVRDAAGNESNEVSTEFRLWRSAPVVNSDDVSIQNCTIFNGDCYSDQLNQTLEVNVSKPTENQYFEFYLSGDVNGPNTNTWLLYKDYGGTIPFNITSGDWEKNVTFQVRSPSGKLSNSITKKITLSQNAPSVNFQANNSICNSDSTPSVCKTFQFAIPLNISASATAVEMYISGNVDSNHATYWPNVNNWINVNSSKTIAVTDWYDTKNIYLKVRDVFGNESVELLRKVEVIARSSQINLDDDDDDDTTQDDDTNDDDDDTPTHEANDTDSDNDGMPDDWEEEYWFNPNEPGDAEADPDEDGLINVEEFNYGSDPLDPDTDDDGLQDGNELELCPGILNADSDNDWILDGEEITLGTDPCNSDTDGDGIDDWIEIDSGTDPLDPTNNNTVDKDEDGIPDEWEEKNWLDPNDPTDAYTDLDQDGLTNREEYEKGTDLNDSDTDDDGLKDWSEVKTHQTDPKDEDTDGDWYIDGQEVRNGTNPLDPNDPGSNLNDQDANGINDEWEETYYQDLPHTQDWYKNNDSDNDGLTDYQEYTYGTNPHNPDTDEDGLSDYEEIKEYSTDPNKGDSDGDALKDGEEVNQYKTDPNQKDTDGDKFWDGSEIQLGTDPLDPESFPGDRDGDGMPDNWEEENWLNPDSKDDANRDPDKDGLSNRAEYQWNTDPNNPDTDGDGITDGREVQIGTDPLDKDSKFPDENKNGIDDNWEMLYFKELRDDLGSRDYDSDGLSDKLEYDYKTNPLKEDTDDDGLTDAEEIFVYGTDPLDPKSNKKYFAITNIKDNAFLSTGDPLIKGIAPPHSIVKIIFKDQSNQTIGEILSRADESSIFVGKLSTDLNQDKLEDVDLSKFVSTEIVSPITELDDWQYYVSATLYDLEGRKRNNTKKILFEVDATLNLNAPNPEFLSVEELTAENFFKGVEVVICDRVPEVRGTTYFGSQVVATWRSLVLTSSLIADSDVGDFAIKSPKALEIGNHTVTLYAITPDGIRSPDLTVPFKITGEDECHGSAPKESDDYEETVYNWLWLGSTLWLGLIGFWFIIILWRRRDKKEKISIKLEKMGYLRAEDKGLKLKTVAEDKIFTKHDSLKDMERFLEFAKWKEKQEQKNSFKKEWENNLQDWKKWKKWSREK